MTRDMKRTAVVLGASRKPDRYGYLAMRRLLDSGFPVVPVNPAYDDIDGLECVPDLRAAAIAAGGGIDTLTLYVGPYHLEPLISEIVECRPRRVIFNPGTESQSLQDALDKAEIPWMEACTLVLLSTGQY